MAFNHFASASGLGALGVSWSDFIIQLITFILGYLVLRKWAFGPIIKALKARHQLIDDGVKLGQEMHHKKEQLEQQIQDQLRKARAQADQIVSEAEQNAKELINNAETKAQDRSKAIIDEASLKTKQDITLAKQKLESEIIGLVGEVTEALIDQKIDDKEDTKIIARALSQKAKA